ncbi:hypothetical protein PHMEG_0008698 [Phytophthora megakarya]|uniref:Uncharacterized protein n=1 Tax=Phytophthora megakarya TaxID=4795 RepID=A0A225WJE3_9STRA|nr:hypothetical protein PHMEG_0008698 [Phytophthora megakarya]
MYQTVQSRRAAVALSGLAILSAVPRASQRQIEGSHCRSIEAGSRDWLYLDRVKEGYAGKLAHQWHGPFRVAEKVNEFSVKLEIADTGCPTFPVVHLSKLKLFKDFPDRPRIELTVVESDRVDFDEILLPKESWIPDLGPTKWEEDVVSWDLPRIPGYNKPSWGDEADLNCEPILNTFLRERANRISFNV